MSAWKWPLACMLLAGGALFFSYGYDWPFASGLSLGLSLGILWWRT